jgi:hypothetical protein
MMTAKRLTLLAPALAGAWLLTGCPKDTNPHLAHLYVQCEGGPKLDEKTEPPETGMACPAGSNLTFSFDNQGGYAYGMVFAVTRDDVVFFLPNSKTGSSISVPTAGAGLPLEGRFTLPPKTRDIMAFFTKDPLTAQDVDKRTRDVTLGQLPGTEVRVRVSKEVGPIN